MQDSLMKVASKFWARNKLVLITTYQLITITIVIKYGGIFGTEWAPNKLTWAYFWRACNEHFSYIICELLKCLLRLS